MLHECNFSRIRSATSACLIFRFGCDSRTSRIFTPIGLLVALRPRRPHRRPARSIQQSKLDADRIGDFAHDAAQRIDLAHQVPFGNSANRRIARHLRDQVGIEREQGGPQPHACRCHRGLASGMSGADHDHVELFGKWRQGLSSLATYAQSFVLCPESQTWDPSPGIFQPGGSSMTSSDPLLAISRSSTLSPDPPRTGAYPRNTQGKYPRNRWRNLLSERGKVSAMVVRPFIVNHSFPGELP